MRIITTIGLIMGVWISLALPAFATSEVKLDKVHNDLCDKASLQRGAGLYANYCAGCHSLEYVRFSDLAKNLFVDDKGKVLEKKVNSLLNFTSDRVTDNYLVSMTKKDGETWFGVAPPDLSLVTRSRGKDWVYTYLRSFYLDPKRPWGVNNLIFPDVAMPHVLFELQGTQVPVVETINMTDENGKPYEKQVIAYLETQSAGLMSGEAFDGAMTDLVNFLEYVAEPHKLERKRIGVWVILFLVVFTFFAYLLKREYWKDIH